LCDGDRARARVGLRWGEDAPHTPRDQAETLFKTRLDTQCAMVVAMTAMGMMQMATHEVVDMIAVRDRIVSATGPMHMSLRVSRTLMRRRARIRVFLANRNFAFVDVIFVHVMHVSVVEVIDMVSMA